MLNGPTRKGSERRRTPRQSQRTLVYFTADVTLLRGIGTNLSARGIGIQTQYVFAPGTALSLKVKLDGHVYLARGKVRWANETLPALIGAIPSRMGIEFTAVDVAFQRYLRTVGGQTE